MSCGNNDTFLREPAQQNLLAMGNQVLTIGVNLWQDTKNTIPYDLTGYTSRGALRLQSDPAATPIPLSTLITQSAVVCNVTGTLAIGDVEQLSVNTPYIYDLSVDNGVTLDSFCVITGIITFQAGASE